MEQKSSIHCIFRSPVTSQFILKPFHYTVPQNPATSHFTHRKNHGYFDSLSFLFFLFFLSWTSINLSFFFPCFLLSQLKLRLESTVRICSKSSEFYLPLFGTIFYSFEILFCMKDLEELADWWLGLLSKEMMLNLLQLTTHLSQLITW